MNKTFLSLLTCLLSSSAIAAQQITVYGDETVEAEISRTELNRITLQGDRVLNVKSSQQALDIKQQYDVPISADQYDALQKSFYIDQNPDSGEIYIKPAYSNSQNSIDLYITTEKQKTFAISLKPKNIEAQTIRVSPPGSTIQAMHWETQTPYQQTLIELIKSMRLRQTIEGYHVQQTSPEDLRKTDKKDIKVQLLARYTGHALIGEIHEVANYTDAPFIIDESTLFSTYSQDTKSLAVASSSHVVLPNTFSQVYRVVPHE